MAAQQMGGELGLEVHLLADQPAANCAQMEEVGADVEGSPGAHGHPDSLGRERARDTQAPKAISACMRRASTSPTSRLARLAASSRELGGLVVERHQDQELRRVVISEKASGQLGL